MSIVHDKDLLYAPNRIVLMEKGICMRIPFKNGYTASLVRHDRSYGGNEGFWEIAVMMGEKLVYDTPITGDVVGWLNPDEVNRTLGMIEKLPVRGEK